MKRKDFALCTWKNIPITNIVQDVSRKPCDVTVILIQCRILLFQLTHLELVNNNFISCFSSIPKTGFFLQLHVTNFNNFCYLFVTKKWWEMIRDHAIFLTERTFSHTRRNREVFVWISIKFHSFLSLLQASHQQVTSHRAIRITWALIYHLKQALKPVNRYFFSKKTLWNDTQLHLHWTFYTFTLKNSAFACHSHL